MFVKPAIVAGLSGDQNKVILLPHVLWQRGLTVYVGFFDCGLLNIKNVLYLKI